MKACRFLFLAAALLGGCSAASSPALDSAFYEGYRGATLTAERGGFLVLYPDRKRGTDRICFPPQITNEVGGLAFGSQGFGPGTRIIRKIGAGEQFKVEEIVYFDGLPGAWAKARLLQDDQECVIQASRGLQMHLLFTIAQKAEWDALPAQTRQVILARQIQRGLTKMQVLLSWGDPFKTITATTPEGDTETWVYQRGEKNFVYLSFTGGVLQGWRE